MGKLQDLKDLMQFFQKKLEHYKGGYIRVFSTNKLLKQVNCTSVTLIPKIPNPSMVKDFRHIACCSVLYKFTSKILTSRLQKVAGDVISECQAGFVPM